MSEYILSLENICRTYRTGSKDLPVLKGVDLQLSAGEWCCIYGASGSGKTTLLNIIGLLESPDRGELRLCGQNPGNFSRSKIAGFRAKKIGFVFQSYHLLPELNMLENVALAGMIAGHPRHKCLEKANELIAKVGLDDRKYHRPAELSGGEQQRAAIARALINDPPLLLADEPTGNLDPDTGTEILSLFQDLQQNSPELTILMITHNREISALATRVTELRDGILN